MSLKFKLSIELFLLFISLNLFSQATFYDINNIQKIELFFSQQNWDYQLDTAKYGNEGYVYADSIKINGVLFSDIGVKYKGNSSYDSTYKKNPLHIELDTYKNQSYQGIKDIKLSNCYSDPSMLREVLSYAILKNYMHCPRSNYAKVYINGVYTGLYSNSESIGKQFLSNKYYSSNNTFIKCNPIVNPGPTTKCNLKYLSPDSSQYINFYELKSKYGWNEFVRLCDTVTNYANSIPSVMDIDRVLWMHAFNNILVNLDSYSGAFCQNYYLYKDNTLRFSPIIWDLNMSFGGFSFAGSGLSSLGTLTLTNMQQLPLTLHSNDGYWPLIKNMLSNPMYKHMYVAHAKTIANEYFINNSYQSLAEQLQERIDSAIQIDSNKFFTYQQFQNGMTGNVTSGNFTIPGITNLMNSRITFLQGTSEFMASPPGITNISYFPSFPNPGDTVWITANITSPTYAYLGYRDVQPLKFNQTQFWDDGLHHDGNANDGTYGAYIVSSSSPIIQYYLYAENANAGLFAPARAEHEFYTILLNTGWINVGDVKINEFMAKNDTAVMSPSGKYEDWIELYNTTTNNINLAGAYVSDDILNSTKWKFPSNTIIPANGLLTLWCDGDTSQPGIHASFKLAATGSVITISRPSGEILDSITYGPQSADISMSRCPDGTGIFAVDTTPTYNQLNCSTAGIIENLTPATILSVFPNPSSDYMYVLSNNRNELSHIEIYNNIGQRVFEINLTNQYSLGVNTSGFDNGLYIIKINHNTYIKAIIQH